MSDSGTEQTETKSATGSFFSVRRLRRRLPYWFNRLLRATHYSLVRTLFILILTLINPFDVIEESEQRSREVWQDVYAEGYFQRAFETRYPDRATARAALDRREDPPGRDDMTVLLIGQRGLQALAPSGNLDPFDIYDLVEQIRYAPQASTPPGEQPRAIFLDMALGRFAPDGIAGSEIADLSPEEQAICDQGKTAQPQSHFRCMLYLLGTVTGYDQWGDDPACQASPLAKLACIRESGGLPLIFADIRTADSQPIPREQAGYEGLGRIAILAPAHFSDVAEYQLTGSEAEIDRQNAYFELFPAAILYAQHCLEEADGGDACDLSPVEPPTDDLDAATWKRSYWGWHQNYARPLEVIWGIGETTRFIEERDLLTEGTTERYCEPAGGVEASAAAFGRRMLYGIDPGTRERCFYPRSLTYEQIADASPELINMAFSDRLVLVGLADAATNDFVTVPTFGRVPGVFWHAMALDNLIVEGKDYQKAEQVLVGNSFSTNDLNDMLALFLSLIGIGVAALSINRRNRIRQYRRRLFLLKPLSKLKSPGQNEKSLRIAEDIVVRLLIFLATIAWLILIVQLLTGQVSAVPRQYNYAALTIIVFFEMFLLARRILEPLLEWALQRIPLMKRLGTSALERRY